jgi:GNAT superfamily N-acetyltransferase
MTNLRIRTASADDSEAIRNITLSAYQEYEAQMPPAHWKLYRQVILTTLADVGPAEQIVAERDDNIVGTVLLYPAGTILDLPDGSSASLDWPEVRLLAVAPAARGQGIGAALMEECVRRARQSKAVALTLHTNEMMQAAGRMYARMGFVHAPELDFGPIEGVIVKGYRLNLNETSLET